MMKREKIKPVVKKILKFIESLMTRRQVLRRWSAIQTSSPSPAFPKSKLQPGPAQTLNAL